MCIVLNICLVVFCTAVAWPVVAAEMVDAILVRLPQGEPPKVSPLTEMAAQVNPDELALVVWTELKADSP